MPSDLPATQCAAVTARSAPGLCTTLAVQKCPVRWPLAELPLAEPMTVPAGNSAPTVEIPLNACPESEVVPARVNDSSMRRTTSLTGPRAGTVRTVSAMAPASEAVAVATKRRNLRCPVTRCWSSGRRA